LEQQLGVKKDIKEVELLRIENKEIQTQICELVQENVALTRQIGEMQQCIERWEQHNFELEGEMERMKDDSVNSRIGWSADKNLSGTPSPVCLEAEINEMYKRPHIKALQYIKTHDALEEYIHLSAAAVKICFPNVWVSSKELIQKAKSVPFYRVHEILTRFLMDKIQQPQVCRQDVEVVKNAKI